MRNLLFFFSCYGDHRALHSFPTRRSSDLSEESLVVGEEVVEVDRGQGATRARDRSQVVPEGLVLHLCSQDRKSTRLNSSHVEISYAVFCLKKKIRLLV